MSVNVVAYYRVSTQKQGRSGLGLEAQRVAVERFADAEGFLISAEHIEIETGKGADALERRPELAKALKAARKDKCAVVVAKLDRLSRDVAFYRRLDGSTRAVHRCRTGPERGSIHAAHLRRAGRARTTDDL